MERVSLVLAAASALPAPASGQLLPLPTLPASRFATERALRAEDARFLEGSLSMGRAGAAGVKSSKASKSGKGSSGKAPKSGGKYGRSSGDDEPCGIESLEGSFALPVWPYSYPGYANETIEHALVFEPAPASGEMGVMAASYCAAGEVRPLVAVRAGFVRDQKFRFVLAAVVDPGDDLAAADVLSGEYKCDTEEMMIGTSTYLGGVGWSNADFEPAVKDPVGTGLLDSGPLAGCPDYYTFP